MSALLNSDIAELVRRRFHGPPGDELRYLPLVDSALRQLAHDIAHDPNYQNYLMTDTTTTTATLDADGIADLLPLMDDPRILLDCLYLGDVHPDPTWDSKQPLRPVSSMGQGLLAGNYDALIYHYWLEGTNLNTRSPDNNVTPLVGTVNFRVPYWPTMAQLPELLVEKLVWGHYWTVAEEHKQNDV